MNENENIPQWLENVLSAIFLTAVLGFLFFC